jgi:hypothetical protein
MAHGDLVTFLAQRTNSRVDAQDLAQEAYLGLLASTGPGVARAPARCPVDPAASRSNPKKPTRKRPVKRVRLRRGGALKEGAALITPIAVRSYAFVEIETDGVAAVGSPIDSASARRAVSPVRVPPQQPRRPQPPAGTA